MRPNGPCKAIFTPGHKLEKGVLLCFIDPRARKIRNKASSCPGIFSKTLFLYYVANSPFPRFFLGSKPPTNHLGPNRLCVALLY